MTAPDRYACAAAGWARGAARVYGPLARELVAAAPVPLVGRRVLDLGAGTGLVSDALGAAGARPVALDVSVAMLSCGAADRPPAVAGELTALPLRDGGVDAVVAAFVLNHTEDPHGAFREIARVTRGGGAVLATVYATTNASPVRDRVDAVARAHGHRPPDWYDVLKTRQAPLLGAPHAMAAAARAAGLVAVLAEQYRADPGVSRAEELVDYRLGQAHFAAWLTSLDGPARAAVRERAVAAVTPVMEPYRPEVVRLVARTRPGSMCSAPPTR